MSPSNNIWKYFKKGQNDYKANATHKEAWCSYCADTEVSSMCAGELDAEQVLVDAWPAWTEEATWETCEYHDVFTVIFYGTDMHVNLQQCMSELQ